MIDDEGGDEISERDALDFDPQINGDLFGDYAVLSPGVHIILDGRPISRPTP